MANSFLKIEAYANDIVKNREESKGFWELAKNGVFALLY
ncbi:MAG: hypothetical protein RIT03_1666 [Bacteroidota bacterium]|jgi:hypothetical protein